MMNRKYILDGGSVETLVGYIKKGDIENIKKYSVGQFEDDLRAVKDGKTALMHAIDTGNIKIVEAITNKMTVGDFEYPKTLDKKTAVMYAIEKNNLEMVKIISDRLDTFKEREDKIKILQLYDTNWKTTLKYAIDSKNPEILKLIVKDLEVSSFIQKNNQTKNVLMYAIETGNIDIVEIIINVILTFRPNYHDTLLQMQDKDNERTVLMYAILSKNADITKKILDMIDKSLSGKDLYFDRKSKIFGAKDKNKKTILLYAVLSENNDIFKMVAEHYQNYDFTAAEKTKSLLMYACELKNYDIVKSIIDIFQKKPKTSTYLEQTVRDLCTQRDENNKTVLMYAVLSNNNEIVQEILKHIQPDDFLKKDGIVGNDKSALMYACERKNKQIVDSIINGYIEKKKGDNQLVVQTDESNKTVLMYAVESKIVHIVEKILNIINDTDFMSRFDKLGKTAFIYAAEIGCFECIKSITNAYQEHKKNPYHEWDKWDKHALIYAIINKHDEIAKYIIDNSSIGMIQKKDIHGKNAIIYAIEQGNLDIIKYIFEKHLGYLQGLTYPSSIERQNILDFAKNSNDQNIINYFNQQFSIKTSTPPTTTQTTPQIDTLLTDINTLLNRKQNIAKLITQLK